jgi:hypothetical protein
MATTKNTSTTTEAARIAGALKGLDALRKLEHAVETGDLGGTTAEYHAQCLSDARAFVAALGPMTPEQEGAIAVLAEYIATEIGGSTPNLAPGCWLPLSAMTEAERQAKAEQLDAELAADNAAIALQRKASRKVVSIADRMPAR